MSKFNYQKSIDNINNEKNKKFRVIADKARKEVIIPACKKYGLTFISAMGMYFFSTQDEKDIYDSDQARLEHMNLDYEFDVLGVTFDDEENLGDWVKSVTEKDLGSTKFTKKNSLRNYAINIAKDFSIFPLGRTTADGPSSAETFRQDVLIPALHKYETVTVMLDGTMGYGSSWLQEAFGELVHEFSINDLKKRLTIESEQDSSLVRECWQYVNDR